MGRAAPASSNPAACSDRISGGGGDDTINGGDGVDTAVYVAERANYALSNLGLGWQIADSTGVDGSLSAAPVATSE